MKVFSKILVVLFTMSLASLSLSCRQNASQISFECQRLQGCYSTYASLVKDPIVKNLVENAQRTGNMAQCAEALTSLSKEIKQDCPF